MRKSHSRQCGDADVSDFLAAYSTECVGRGLGHFLSLGNLGYRLPSKTRTRACWGMAFPRHPKTRITTAMCLYAKKASAEIGDKGRASIQKLPSFLVSDASIGVCICEALTWDLQFRCRAFATNIDTRLPQPLCCTRGRCSVRHTHTLHESKWHWFQVSNHLANS